MDYKELTNRLVCAGRIEKYYDEDSSGLYTRAATAITALLARAEEAEARAEKAEKEKDAAVSDLTFAVNKYRLFTTDINLCCLCKFDFPPAGENEQTHKCPGFYRDDCFEWRGLKEE